MEAGGRECWCVLHQRRHGSCELLNFAVSCVRHVLTHAHVSMETNVSLLAQCHQLSFPISFKVDSGMRYSLAGYSIHNNAKFLRSEF